MPVAVGAKRKVLEVPDAIFKVVFEDHFLPRIKTRNVHLMRRNEVLIF